MKVYLSGKISGVEITEAQNKFAEAEKLIRCKFGYDVINPLKLPHDHGHTWEEYLKEDIKAMLTCDSIYMLSDWEISRGATVEYNLAKELNFHFLNFK